MAKLGNDPFLRGAASRDEEPQKSAEQPAPAPARKAASKAKGKTAKPSKGGGRAAPAAKPAGKSARKPAARKAKVAAHLDASAEASLKERIAPGVPPMAKAPLASELPPPVPDEPYQSFDSDEELAAELQALADEDDDKTPILSIPLRPEGLRPEPAPIPEEPEEEEEDITPTDARPLSADELPPEGVVDAEFRLEEDAPERSDARLAPVEFEPARPVTPSAGASGVLALARDIFSQALDGARLKDAVGAATGLVHVVRTAMGAGSAQTLDDYGKDVELERTLAPLTRFFFERYWRVTVEGAHEVPSGACLLVANHSGALPFDGPVLAESLRREREDLEEPRWLIEDQIFHAPFLGTLLNRLGAIRASPENAVRLLGEGRPVIVFPEGIQGMGKPYRERYQLKRFGRGGFAKLALRTGAPIVPVAVVGAEETMPLLARLPGKLFGFPYLPLTPLGPVPLPARWSVRFGEPIAMARSGPGADADLAEVQRLTELTREAIDGMLRAQLRERKSIYL